MSEKCFYKGCEKEGVNYRDCTITGIGDFRHFCDDHVEVHDYEQKIRGMFRDLHYRIGQIDRKLTDATAENNSLRLDLQKIQNLQLWKK